MTALENQVIETITEEVIPVQEQVLSIVESELIPLITEGICVGFILGTLFSLAAYGVFKAISLLSIKNTLR